MSPRQAIAYANPCWRAWETVQAEFSAPVRLRGIPFSTILSVNK